MATTAEPLNSVHHGHVIPEVHRHNVLRRYHKPGFKPRKDWHYKIYKNPQENFVALAEGGAKKTHQNIPQLFVLGVLGGSTCLERCPEVSKWWTICLLTAARLEALYVGFGGMLALTVSGGLDPAWAARFPGIQKLLTGLTFPTALIYIIVAGGELFTSNVMYTTLGLLSRNLNIGKSILVCITAFIANYLGCVLVAGFSVNLAGFLTKDPYHAYLVHAVQAKIIDADFGILVLKAIPANFLVNVAVIMASAAEDVWGKVVAGYLPILSFAVIGMEHCIANDFYAHAAIFTSSQFNYGVWLWKTLIACTLGNIIGGMFVGAAYWYAYLAEAQLGHDHWLLSFRCGRCARKRKTTNDHETEQHHM